MAITKIEVPELFDFGSDNSAFKLPTGTTAERPTSPSNGEMRFNTTTGFVEYYDTTDAQWWEIDYAADPFVAADNFNTVLYTGDGTTGRSIATGLAADLVIIKNRSSALQDWVWYDSIRGASQTLRSNRDSAQYNAGSGQGVSAFGTGTVTIGDNSAGNTGANGSVGGTYSGAALYVMYAFKGGGAAVSNTDGTITSDVSANQAAGFSIVKYQANSTQGATIGHGLNSAPEMIITKEFTGPRVWCVYHKDLTSSAYYLELNTSDAQKNGVNTAYAGVPGSTTYSVGTSSLVNDPSSDSYVAYCFHSVAGYSKIGSYTGSGTTLQTIYTTDDGTSTGTNGFEPSFILIKNTNAGNVWTIMDNKRNTSNPRNLGLFPNLLNLEYTYPGTPNGLSFISNGFTLDTNQPEFNQSTLEYIYMTFA